MTHSLTDHLESHLGCIVKGWGAAGGIQVVQFNDQPEPGIDTFATLGLSKTVLPMDDNRCVRQEFLVSSSSVHDPNQVASFMLTFAEYVVSMNQALLRADVVGPSSPTLPCCTARAIYTAIPVYFPDTFWTYRGTLPPTVIVWLIPIPAEEAELIKTIGWSKYEDLLKTKEVDFFNFSRLPIIVDQ